MKYDPIEARGPWHELDCTCPQCRPASPTDRPRLRPLHVIGMLAILIANAVFVAALVRVLPQ